MNETLRNLWNSPKFDARRQKTEDFSRLCTASQLTNTFPL